jgi:hypothetical protein
MPQGFSSAWISGLKDLGLQGSSCAVAAMLQYALLLQGFAGVVMLKLGYFRV